MCEMCNDNENIQFPEFLDTVGSRFVLSKTENQLDTYTELIKKSIANSNKNFLEIGRLLKEIHDNKLWEFRHESPFDDFATFAQYVYIEFDLTSKSAYRFIQVYEFYTNSRDVATDKYSFSQLQEMCSITEEDKELLYEIKPDMSIKQIRELKHNYYESKNNDKKEVQEQPVIETFSQPVESVKEQKQKLENDYNQALNIIQSDEIQPLVLNNKQQRLDFLNTYRSWELISTLAYLGLKIYRRKLKNKTSIIALVAEDMLKPSNDPTVKYSLFYEVDSTINKPCDYYSVRGKFNLWFNSQNEVVDYLTQHKSEVE